jgi:predicted PurR-regulated permease PerM
LKAIFKFISPVFYGLIIAYVLHPFVEFFEEKVLVNIENKKKRRNLSVLLAAIIVIICISILMIALIPQLIKSVLGLVMNFNTYAKSLQAIISSLTTSLASSNIDISSLAHAGNQFLEMLSKLISANMKSIISTSFNIGSGLFNILISIILAIYFLLDATPLQSGVREFSKAILSPEKYKNITGFWRRCNRILVRYMVFDIIDGIIVGFANFFFFLIMDMPYNILISVVVGITNLAPTFGPIVGGLIGAFILLLVNPWQALWFILFTLVLQTIDGYILKPKLFGNSFGVSSIWILITIIVGGRMFGVWGILLAIPFAAIADYFYRDVIWKKLEKRTKKNT